MDKTCEKEGCKGKVTGQNNKHCDKCSNSEIGSDADSGGLNDVKCIVNELLMYTEFHRHSCTRYMLETVLSGHFSGEIVDAARLCLVREFDYLVLFHPDIKKQWQSSSNRTEVMAMCGDIIRALEELEINDIEVEFVAKNWDILQPRQLE